MLWKYLADALSVIALAIIASTAQRAWRRTRPEARVPLAGLRLNRNLGFGLVPVAAMFILLGLGAEVRLREPEGDMAVLMFALRAFAASTLALLQLRLVAGSLRALEAEGALNA